MEFKRYNDVKTFYSDTCDILMFHEAQNLILLGNLIIGNEGRDKTGWRDPAGWFMAVVSDDKGICLTAVMTPPHNLTLYATNNLYSSDVLACMIEGIIKADIPLSGVMTENKLAEDFARAYADKKEVTCRVNKRQRIYELTKVNSGILSVGKLREARENDMAFLPFWSMEFERDCFGSASSVQVSADNSRHSIFTGKRYILEVNGTPVSMASINREMRTVCGVGCVYTPEYFRGKGYATSCVAEVSRLILERGFSKCVLYTDLSNPTSNSIYQKIGYIPVCDSSEIIFE